MPGAGVGASADLSPAGAGTVMLPGRTGRPPGLSGGAADADDSRQTRAYRPCERAPAPRQRPAQSEDPDVHPQRTSGRSASPGKMCLPASLRGGPLSPGACRPLTESAGGPSPPPAGRRNSEGTAAKTARLPTITVSHGRSCSLHTESVAARFPSITVSHGQSCFLLTEPVATRLPAITVIHSQLCSLHIEPHYGCERPHGWPGAISEF